MLNLENSQLVGVMISKELNIFLDFQVAIKTQNYETIIQ